MPLRSPKAPAGEDEADSDQDPAALGQLRRFIHVIRRADRASGLSGLRGGDGGGVQAAAGGDREAAQCDGPAVREPGGRVLRLRPCPAG